MNNSIISYLEMENTPSVDLSAFRSEKTPPKIKDISNLSKKAEQIKNINGVVLKKDPVEKIIPQSDPNITTKIKPFDLKTIIQKEKSVTWL